MKTILLIGLGRFGRHVALTLHKLGHEVMAVDLDEDKVNDLVPYVTNAVIGDSTKHEFLLSIGASDFDCCIVAIGDDFQSSLVTTAYLKAAGAKFVIARASQDVQAQFLLSNGADEVVYPEKQIAEWTATRFSSENILDYFALDKDFAIYEMKMPQQFIGHTVADLDVRRKYGVNIIATRSQDSLNMTIGSDTILHEDETVMVIGNSEKIKALFNI